MLSGAPQAFKCNLDITTRKANYEIQWQWYTKAKYRSGRGSVCYSAKAI
jgi:hypothetical protein